MKLTDAEWQVMNVLWERFPATARGIAERMPKEIDWAYTTIKTLLSRLVRKKAVSETKKGNISVYEPLLSQNNARRSALKTLIDKAFDGAFTPLVHLLFDERKLSAKQKKQLIKILQNEDKNKKGEQND
jgi:BlaI family penicillinase repressor